jgi:uncharacterized protein (DUF302 family)
MLERTGQDLGAVQQIYSRAEVMEFCSATLSRKVMETDPRLLAFCPFGIGIYTLPGEADQVHVVYRRLRLETPGPAADALQRVEQLLHDIRKPVSSSGKKSSRLAIGLRRHPQGLSAL